MSTHDDKMPSTHLEDPDNKDLFHSQHVEQSLPVVEHGNSTASNMNEHELENLIHNPKGWTCWYFYFQMFIASLAWILFGYDVAIVGALIGLPFFIERYQGEVDGVLAFTPRNTNLLVTVAICGSLFASPVAPYLANRFGRKRTIQIAFGLCCLPSSILQRFAPNLGAMAFARAWNFMGITLAEQITLLYVIEMVPSKYRATTISLSGAMNGLMGVVSTIIMYFCSAIASNKQWTIPLEIQIALPATLCIATFFLQESVGWLLKKGRVEEATANQRRIRRAGRDDLVEAEIAAMLAALEEEERALSTAKFMDIFKRKNIKRTLSASLLGCMTSCSGYSLTTTYGIVILIAAGVSDPFRWQIITALLALCGQIVGGILNDYIGRRPLTLGGLTLVAIFDYIAGGIGFTGIKTTQQGTALAAVSIMLAFFCQVAFAGVYTFEAEIPTMVLREYTIAYGIQANLVATIISTTVFPYLLGAPSNLGPKTYLVVGAFTTVGTIACYFLIPETANLTWLEIDQLYDEGVQPWRMKGYKTRAMTEIKATSDAINQRAAPNATAVLGVAPAEKGTVY